MPLTKKSRSFSIDFEEVDWFDDLALLGLYTYLKRHDHSVYQNPEALFSHLSNKFNLSDPSLSTLLSSLAGSGLLSHAMTQAIVKNDEKCIQNPLTNELSMPRVTTVHSETFSPGSLQESRDQSQRGFQQDTKRLSVRQNIKEETLANKTENHKTKTVSGDRETNGKLILTEASFPETSALYPIKDLVIEWWNKHKAGKKTLIAWKTQKAEFKKIHLDEDTGRDIEAIKLILEKAIFASKSGKAWMGIQYSSWVAYNKSAWIAYRNGKARSNGNSLTTDSNGVVSQPRSGPWIGRLEIPAST
jgi:hypothetical protein